MKDKANIIHCNDITQSKFSIFAPPIKNKTPLKEVSALDVYKVITSTKYKAITDKLRAIETKEEQNKFKVSQFHFATFSGTFTNREAKDIINHSGLICVDIDGVQSDKIEALKETLPTEFAPELMFVSPRGNGLKVVYQIDIDSNTHLAYFKALETYFYQQHALCIDAACKDVVRACFLPYDSEAYFNENPTKLDQSFIDTFPEIEKVVQTPENQPKSTFENESGKRIIDTACRMIHEAQDGEKHNTLLRAAHLCGGAIAGGLIGEFEAVQSLEAAISGKKIDSFSDAQKTIKKGIEKGKTAPLEPSDYHREFTQNKPTENEPIKQTPLLPIEGLPQQAQRIINECSEVMGTPRDLWAQSFIAATALAIGTSVTLQTKYRNNPALWLVSVAHSGTGKTESDKIMFAPFHNKDSEGLKDHQLKKAEFDRIKSMNKTEREKEGITDLPTAPIYSQYVLGDTTPEALIVANINNPTGICVQRDEFAGLINDFGRYNKSGEQQNWLSAYSQSPMTVNRKGGEVLKINRPFINISGSIQPSILPELTKDNRDSNGFLARILFAYPDKCERPEYRTSTISEYTKQQISEYIERLLSLRNLEETEPLRLSSEAEQLYKGFYNKNTQLSNETKADYLRAVYAKLDIACLRLSIVLHCSKWAMTGEGESEVSSETMQASIDLAEYYRATAIKVYNHLSNGKESELDKKTVAKYLRSLGSSQNEIATALKVSQQYIDKILKKAN